MTQSYPQLPSFVHHLTSGFMGADFIAHLLGSVVGAGIVFSGIAWLTRSIVTQWLSKDIERHKALLKSEADLATERLRSALQMNAARRNIEYSRLHEKRLEIIAELAGLLDTFMLCVGAYVSPFGWEGDPPKDELRTRVADAFAEFNRFFRPRRFFLPPHTVKKIEDFRTALYGISMDFMLHVEKGKERGIPWDKNLDTWTKASKYAQEEAPKVMKELEDDFRRILLDERDAP